MDLSADVIFAEDPVADGLGPRLDPSELALFTGLADVPQEVKPKLSRGLNYSHEAMIDAIVAEPGITQNELAQKFGYTAAWISQIINSDVFQAKLAQRAHEFRDPILLASMEEQLRGIMARGLELTRKKLEANEVSDNFLLRSMELSTRALGYGAKKEDAGKKNIEEKLVDLSDNLVKLLHKGKRLPQTFDAGDQ